MLERTFVLRPAELASVALPPMPADDGFEAMRAWHLDVLRMQHQSIPDALSGKRLDAKEDCVQIAITGTDASNTRTTA